MIDLISKTDKRIVWLERCIRLMLGVVFIYAGIPKITDPAAFAKIIYGYGIFPEETINAIAIVLPVLELFTGIMLVTGFWVDSASLIICVMLLMFIGIISFNIMRGHVFDCGCFSVTGRKSLDPLQLLIRDVGLFLCGMYLFFYHLASKGD